MHQNDSEEKSKQLSQLLYFILDHLSFHPNYSGHRGQLGIECPDSVADRINLEESVDMGFYCVVPQDDGKPGCV